MALMSVGQRNVVGAGFSRSRAAVAAVASTWGWGARRRDRL